MISVVIIAFLLWLYGVVVGIAMVAACAEKSITLAWRRYGDEAIAHEKLRITLRDDHLDPYRRDVPK